jgi:hypothetical protein
MMLAASHDVPGSIVEDSQLARCYSYDAEVRMTACVICNVYMSDNLGSEVSRATVNPTVVRWERLADPLRCKDSRECLEPMSKSESCHQCRSSAHKR